MSRFNILFELTTSADCREKEVIGKNTKDYKTKGLNQVNGFPQSLAPGLYEYQQQFAEMGFVDLRAHDLFGVGDIDSYYNTRDSHFNDQVTNNAPDDQKEGLKHFLDNFINRRTLVTNAEDVYNKDASPIFNWTPTDSYLRRAMSNPFFKGSEKPNILFRLGRMINGGGIAPKDFEKYAGMVRSIVKRYSVDYQLIGLPYPVTEYEIWNEPDLGSFWYAPGPQTEDATSHQFYIFYETVARGIKDVAPQVSVGGPGVAGAYGSKKYVDDFLEYVAQHSVPMDFYSLHLYPFDNPDRRGIIAPAVYVKDVLERNHLHARMYITEWNVTPFGSKENNTKVQSVFNASFIIYFLLNHEGSGLVDKAYYYRGDSAEFGLFNNETSVTPAAQAFWLYNQLTKEREKTLSILSVDVDGIKLEGEYEASTIFATAGVNKDNKTLKVLAVQYTPDVKITGYEATHSLPEGQKLFAQHFVDSSLPAEDLTGSNEYYGGENNQVNSNDYYYGSLVVPERNHNLYYSPLDSVGINTANSSAGNTEPVDASEFHLKINGLNMASGKYTVSVQRIVNGGSLDSLVLPSETIVKEVPIVNDSFELVDDYSKYGNYSVHLYTITLSD